MNRFWKNKTQLGIRTVSDTKQIKIKLKINRKQVFCRDDKRIQKVISMGLESAEIKQAYENS